MKFNIRKLQGAESRAYTLAEVMVSVFVLAIMLISLYAGFASGFAVVRLARENLRATQIMLQKMETIRLLKWSQLLDTNNFLQPTFQDYYDPIGTNSQSAGAMYRGFITTNAAIGIPNAYKDNMRLITVTIFWTNYPQKPSTNVIVRTRQMQTLAARFGMQNYVYQ
jgi:type II secretory pathway pseudopilin PulG